MESFNNFNDNNKLIMGEIEDNQYILTQFKHIKTQSVISKKRIEAICTYLRDELENGGQEHFITINDQIPVRVSSEEMNQLLEELRFIKEGLKES
ncbi:hypothetical protein [Fredinandcohnia sp. 179-A 10B2 NHS]|uniref:hypothetical protein n=1 Tax=Fredinandcohnia sp. 179-A 10B2 NHS TaxID=3235176 RepID=UPI0039A296A8